MIKKSYLSRYTPSLLDPETLEAIFVRREELAARLVDRIRQSVLTSNKHYTLLLGPRGIGKTHLVSLVYYRVLAQADLEDRLRIAWLREEECVVSFLDFLETILGVLQEEHGDEQLERECERLADLSPDEAELRAEQLLLETVGDRTLLLIVENLDEIFRGLGKLGQEKLRALIQNHPVLTILATSQSLFSGVSLRASPFYGFFEPHHLQELSFEDAVTMMTKIARHQRNEKLASMIQTPRGRYRVRAVHHLAGGSPRVYVIFSQLVTRESLDDLVEPVLRTLDDLTPYYQDRMRHLSPQQRKMVDFFCQRGHAISVGEIAKHNRVTPQTASSQLKKLLDMGYVRAHRVGRESYYELREPLMRISRDAKKFRGKSIRLLVSFLRNWYSHAELGDALRRFVEKSGIDMDGQVAIVRDMLIRTREVATWRRHIETWIELFGKHGVLPALGQGLVRSIPTLAISWIDNETARAWRDAWWDLGRGCPELEIPLRLLDAAVRYHEQPGVRVLLGLPIEERELLKPLLGLIET